MLREGLVGCWMSGQMAAVLSMPEDSRTGFGLGAGTPPGADTE